jgi:hypothetical protein
MDTFRVGCFARNLASCLAIHAALRSIARRSGSALGRPRRRA